MLNGKCCKVPLAQKKHRHTRRTNPRWVTLTIMESNVWLCAWIEPVSRSIQCCIVAENERRREKRSVLSRRYRHTNQAGIIFTDAAVTSSLLTFTKHWFKVVAAVHWRNSSHPLVWSDHLLWCLLSMVWQSESRACCPTLTGWCAGPSGALQYWSMQSTSQQLSFMD